MSIDKRSTRTLLLLLLLAISAIQSAPVVLSAEKISIERLGPCGGTVRSLLITSDSDVVYLGTWDGQIFKSSDAGRHWLQLYPGLKRRQFVIDTIVEDPAHLNHIYAGGWDVRSSGGGLFETRDAGRSWTQVALPKPNVAVRGFAISRQHPEYMVAATNAGIFGSSNGGRGWLQLGGKMTAFLQAESVAIDPEDPRYLFVGTWHLGYRSSDFGKTWVQNQNGMILDSDVFSIAIDPHDPQNMFASACTGIYRSINHGVSWTRLKVFPKSFQVRAHIVHVDPKNSTRIYGGTTEGLFLSQDSGKNWKRATPADWVVNAVQANPDDGAILIATENHGVVRSIDGGETWAASNDGYVGRAIARVIPDKANPGRFYIGEVSEGKNGGFYLYDNPINDWVPLKPDEIPGEGLLSMLDLPDGAGRMIGTARGIVLRRPDSDQWVTLPGPIGKVAVYDLALDKSWVFAGTSAGIFRARIEDLQFERPRNYTVIPRVFTLFAAPNTVMFAGTHIGVLRSDNFGETWTISSAGIPESATVQCLISSPAAPDHFFAGTTAGLFQSWDGGRTWARIVDGKLGVDIPSIIFLDGSGLRMAAADNTFGGVLVSNDAGAHWTKIEDPQFGSPVRALAQDPLHPSILYLGTATEGVYRVHGSPAQGTDKR